MFLFSDIFKTVFLEVLQSRDKKLQLFDFNEQKTTIFFSHFCFFFSVSSFDKCSNFDTILMTIHGKKLAASKFENSYFESVKNLVYYDKFLRSF